MNYEAILFDMDGVVIDTYRDVTAFWQKFAQIYQVELTPADFEQHIYGCPARHTFDHLFPQLTVADRQTVVDEMVDYEIKATYTEIKGVIPFLRALKEQAIPTALVTSGQNWKVEAVISQLELEGLFVTHITADDIQQGKPDPECYLLAAARLRIAPERCVVFEDALSGVKAAVRAGALCIGVQPSPQAKTLLDAGACRVVPDFGVVDLELVPSSKNGEAALNLWIDAAWSLPLALS